MNRNEIDIAKASKQHSSGTTLNAAADVGEFTNLDDPRQLAIKRLLETASDSVDDKLATVKAAHHVHKDRFQSAFRSLMDTPKS